MFATTPDQGFNVNNFNNTLYQLAVIKIVYVCLPLTKIRYTVCVFIILYLPEEVYNKYPKHVGV